MVAVHPLPCRANMPAALPHRTLALAEHLLAQGAPKAASRLAAAQLEPAVNNVPQFEVPAERIFMVDGSCSAVEAFCSAMAAAVARRAIIAIDAEWRPDATRSSNHPPALVQVASASSSFAAEADAVWLLDFERPRRMSWGWGGLASGPEMPPGPKTVFKNYYSVTQPNPFSAQAAP